MKKLLAILLALTLIISCVAFAEEEEEFNGLTEVVAPEGSTPENTLLVGTPAMNGDFIYGFGSNAYDVSVQDLVNGFCSVVVSTSAGELVVNETVVASQTAEEDADGNKVYTYTLCDDLKWSDGSAITAKDYVAYLLWMASPKSVEAGFSSSAGLGLLGYNAYYDGEADAFAGVKLVDELTFSLTIDAAELPYFWEISYANTNPLALDFWAPGCEIVSDENGAKFDPEYDILAAMQNMANNRSNPGIGCGPYKLLSYENNAATLELNEYFKGDLDGDKPTIKYVVQSYVNTDLDVQMVIDQSIDITTGVIEGKKIEAAKASTTTGTHSFLRYGYGLLAMHCDWGVTSDPNVRWALAYLIDRNEVIDYVLGGYGGAVQGNYAYAEWMYEEAGVDLEDELVAFNLNIDKANECLDQTEWVYEADGTTPFDASKANAEGTYMRYNANGEPLVVKHLGSTGNDVTRIIQIQYAANAPLAGVDFQVTESDFNALLDNYYYGFELGEERTYNTFNLATGFGNPNDPYTSWHSDWVGTINNSCQLADDELDELIMAMRGTTPGDNDAFIDAWIAFQVRWQELMPQIPLYCNEYFTIYDYSVTGVESISPFWDWDDAICKMQKVSADEAAAIAAENN